MDESWTLPHKGQAILGISVLVHVMNLLYAYPGFIIIIIVRGEGVPRAS